MIFVFTYVLFEIKNILVGAHKYFYCLNNNFAIYANIKMRYNENREIRGGMIQSNFSNSNLQGERIFVRVKEISSYRN
jgi:orotate phosphoribosyltransferase-like protein